MRPIDADALFKRVSRLDVSKQYLPIDFQEEIMGAPTVDAVPVVRCKDCKRAWHSNGMLDCFNGDYGPLSPVDPDWFCADGERRDDDEQAD